MLSTQEHIDLIEQFERDLGLSGYYIDREPRSMWERGHIYCHGPTNDQFLAYRWGYAFGKCKFQNSDALTAPSATSQQK